MPELPLLRGVEPVKISWSQLRLYDECPAKSELMRKHKPAVQDMRNFFHGNVVDLAMRTWLTQPRPEPGWMAAHIEEMFEKSLGSAKAEGGVIRWKTPSDRAEVLEFCRELVIRLEEILNKFCLPFDWHPAYRFHVPLRIPYIDGKHSAQITLTGEIDLLVFDNTPAEKLKPGIEPGRIAIWDLKGTANEEYYRKVMAQLVFYAIAVKASKAERLGRWAAKTGLIQPMCEQRVRAFDITEDAIREMAGRIERVAHARWNGPLPPKVSDTGCNYCEVRHACSKFKTAPGQQRGRVAVPG
jgi:CRISPR/Cas system-associated exonuclease Cas4 (RecB family)